MKNLFLLEVVILKAMDDVWIFESFQDLDLLSQLLFTPAIHVAVTDLLATEEQSIRLSDNLVDDTKGAAAEVVEDVVLVANGGAIWRRHDEAKGMK